MALMFSNLFDKKGCAICGKTLGVMGNTKLSDGVICKDCYRKLSPYAAVRKDNTVQDIADHLAYREKNQTVVDGFHITRTLGEGTRLLLDEDHKGLMVTSASNIRAANPDVLTFDQINGCELKIDEDEDEIKTKDAEGKSVSYDPPRHTYDYDFYLTIYVNSPWFEQIRFQVNPSSVRTEDKITTQVVPLSTAPAAPGAPRPSALKEIPVKPDPEQNEEYRKYKAMAEEMRTVLLNLRQYGSPDAPAAQPVSETPVQPAPAAQSVQTAVKCPWCGSENAGGSGFCAFCGGSLNG